MKIIKSRIREFLPKDLLIELNNICYDVTIPDNNTKINLMVTALDKYDVEYTELGSGTNRHAILIDGFVFKIAMDRFGVKDNWAEFAIAKELQPYVTKTYECNGLIVVAEYVTVISKDEFLGKKDKIRQILSYLAQGYLMGDVGSISKNFMNWGYRDDGQLVILDFAYIYRIKGEEMVCGGVNSNGDICDEFLEYDENFYKLTCPRCRKTYTFYDIRKKIDPKYEMKEVEMTKQLAYQTTDVVMVIDGSDTPKEEITHEDIYGKDEETMCNKENEYANEISAEELEARYENAMADMPSVFGSGDIEEVEEIDAPETLHFNFDDIMETADEYFEDIVEDDEDSAIKSNPEYEEMRRSTVGGDEDDEYYADPEEEYLENKYDEVMRQMEETADDHYDDKPSTISETIAEITSDEFDEDYAEIEDDPECVVMPVEETVEEEQPVSSITFIEETDPEVQEEEYEAMNEVVEEESDVYGDGPEPKEDLDEEVEPVEEIEEEPTVVSESVKVETEVEYGEENVTTTTRTTVEKVEVQEKSSFIQFMDEEEPSTMYDSVDEMREMLKADSDEEPVTYDDEYDEIYDEIKEEQMMRKHSQKKGGPSWQ